MMKPIRAAGASSSLLGAKCVLATCFFALVVIFLLLRSALIPSSGLSVKRPALAPELETALQAVGPTRHRVVDKFKPGVCDCHNDAFTWAGLEATSESDWDVSFHTGYGYFRDFRAAQMKDTIPYSSFSAKQRFNPCPGLEDLGSKEFSCQIYKRGYEHAKECYFYPAEKAALLSAWKPGTTWYIKPMGDVHNDLKVVQDQKLLPSEGDWVIQRNIENPFLVQKKKTDLRLWVVIASLDPLRVYWYSNSVLRTARKDFEPGFDKLTDLCMQMTRTPSGGCSGAPLDVTIREDMIKDVAERKGIDAAERLFQNIEDTIMTAVVEGLPAILKKTRQRLLFPGNCFSYAGVDVMVDDDENAYLVEVNHLPDLDYTKKYMNWPPGECRIRTAMKGLVSILGFKTSSRYRHNEFVDKVANLCNSAATECSPSDIKELLETFDQQEALNEDTERGGSWLRLYPRKGVEDRRWYKSLSEKMNSDAKRYNDLELAMIEND